MSRQSKDPLLQPLRIRHVEFRNRVMSTSHACGLEEGRYPQQRYQAYHEEKAKGGLALTMFGGSSNVSPDSPNVFGQIYVGDDGVIPHLQTFSGKVHDAGARIMCQITHLGRRGESFSDRVLPTIGPSMVRETLHRSFPKAMDKFDIRRVIGEYADAAWRCKEGGLDGIETLAGGHLIGQFLSPVTNLRTDEYGGSSENRCRFGLEVLDAIRERVGDDFLVGLRFHVDEGHAEGLDSEQSLEIAQRFEAAGFLDFFNANYGRMDTMVGLAEHNMPGMAAPLAPWLAKAGAFKKSVSLPVFHAARITDLETARYAVESGLLDMVAMTRAHIADPHIVRKLESGEAHRIRPCVGATHCMGSSTRPSCLHNPVTGRETVLSHKIVPLHAGQRQKRVVVVGGGPAGLEAARIASERNHSVILLEAETQLGGQVQLALKASWRRDLAGVIDWRVAELESLGTDIRLNCLADKERVLDLDPDVVIIATGGVPDTGWIQGEELVTTAWDILSGQVPAAESTIVYDGTGRHVAPTVAEKLISSGSKVEMISIDDHFGMELAYAEQTIWRKRCYEIDLPMTFNRRLVSVERENNQLQVTFKNELTGDLTIHTTDQFVVEHGTTPADDLFLDLQPLATNKGITNINAWTTATPQPPGHPESIETPGHPESIETPGHPESKETPGHPDINGTGNQTSEHSQIGRKPTSGHPDLAQGGKRFSAAARSFHLYRIGDAISSRNIHTAILDAHRLMAKL